MSKQSMKCRCGSNDECIFKNGKMLRAVDEKPHVCIGQATTAPKQTLEEMQDFGTMDELEQFAFKENPKLSKISRIVEKQLRNEEKPPNELVIGSAVWVRTLAIYTQWKLEVNGK